MEKGFPLKSYASLFFTLAILMTCAFAGCLGGKAPTASQESAPVILVDYTRSGGVEEADDRLVIFDNGAAIVVTRNVSRSVTLNSTELERISAVFDQAKFPELQDNYPSHHGKSGLYQYSISYSGKTVTLDESSYPAGIDPILRELNQIVSGVTS